MRQRQADPEDAEQRRGDPPRDVREPWPGDRQQKGQRERPRRARSGRLLAPRRSPQDQRRSPPTKPASVDRPRAPQHVYSSCSATMPRAISPSAKIRPPWKTIKIANAAAGIATSDPAPRSDRRRSPARGRPGAVLPRALTSLPPPEPALRRWYSSSAASNSSRSKSGHSSSEKYELRVGALPQQEVREPLLAAGADDQLGVVHVGRVEACCGTPLRRRPRSARAACRISARPP